MNPAEQETLTFQALYPKVAEMCKAVAAGTVTCLPPYGLASMCGLNEAEFAEAKREFPVMIRSLELMQGVELGAGRGLRHAGFQDGKPRLAATQCPSAVNGRTG